MPRTLVSLGSNLGDAATVFDAAIEKLRRLARGGLLQVSRRHRTEPIGGPPGQAAFLNAVVGFETTLPPDRLLAALQGVEAAHDRQRPERWAARTLDLDLLLYGDEVIDQPGLRVPHPRMTFRPFVLGPAVEIAADWPHPETGQTLGELWERLRSGDDGLLLLGDDNGVVRRWVGEIRSSVTINDASAKAPRLTIDAQPTSAQPGPGDTPPSGPRLALSDCAPEHWRDEVLAALDCVWPTGPR
ncbi:2-amino-4-hydroxy-6-hydroxymethyldihydropteridine pyrophosphokinase [Botrimarina colliarenosi]|uniref:2-amino-4-hydroxy-6-hydroxymethyldihydropteridine pyrophosphokinase n=1 Tax=Botrimarina colliarenosi TaxID=2528001 RepID=A0A5C6ABF1_9BACT|nr:2-amino-4-hydroxy-6-hydroxymethyldihydropteridine diphosphokinase [Botrimarina colliarenosi]TWT96697.1 2-amino-4-hydroxy-6-hydroxymethyldihydropteridine pyrophosphokinase [Botrimarina colliarenosi]